MEPHRTTPGGPAGRRARKLLRAGRTRDQRAPYGAGADPAAYDAPQLGADALARQPDTGAGGGKIGGNDRARPGGHYSLRTTGGAWSGGGQAATGRGEPGLPALATRLGVSR